MDTAKSHNGVPIRVTSERWFHITENHDDLAGHYENVLETVENPDYVVRGYRDAFLALKRVSEKKYLVVVYKETTGLDGFVVTAYFTGKLKVDKEEIIWQKKQ